MNININSEETRINNIINNYNSSVKKWSEKYMD